MGGLRLLGPPDFQRSMPPRSTWTFRNPASRSTPDEAPERRSVRQHDLLVLQGTELAQPFGHLADRYVVRVRDVAEGACEFVRSAYVDNDGRAAAGEAITEITGFDPRDLICRRA
jgi:hypothetical protein